MFPTTEEDLAILTNAMAEIADSGVARESDDDACLEEDTKTPEKRYGRYVQNEQCEVSDPDESVDIYTLDLSVQRVRDREQGRQLLEQETTPGTTLDRPTPKAMPKPLAESLQSRLADRTRCGIAPEPDDWRWPFLLVTMSTTVKTPWQ